MESIPIRRIPTAQILRSVAYTKEKTQDHGYAVENVRIPNSQFFFIIVA